VKAYDRLSVALLADEALDAGRLELSTCYPVLFDDRVALHRGEAYALAVVP